MYIWISLFIATIVIQIPNIFAINIFVKDPSFRQAFIIALYFLPFSLISTTLFSYYYGIASNNNISYPVITVSAVGFNIFCSIIIHQFILKSKPILIIDYIGISILILGLLIIIFRDSLYKFF